MAALTDYRGLQVVTPDPTGAGGLALNNDLKYLADRAGPVHSAAADPDTDDDDQDTGGNGKFYLWSKWLNTSSGAIFVCVDASVGAAIWAGATSTDKVPYSGATGPVDLGAQNLTTTGNLDAGNMAFQKVGNLVSQMNPEFDEDFVFGSTQLSDTENPLHDSRMFFDKGKGAFRVGKVLATEWDDANVGDYSIGLGYSAIASNTYSVAMGSSVTASGSYSVAVGANATASGSGSVVIGRAALGTLQATGAGSVAIGYEVQATQDYATAMGKSFINNTANSFAVGFGQIDFLVASGAITFPNNASLDAGSGNITTTGLVQGVTQAEFDTLTDDSMADALHRHSELSASDGDPDKSLYLDASGYVNIQSGVLYLNRVANNPATGLYCYSDAISHKPSFIFGKSHVDTLGSRVETINDDILGSLLFHGVDSGSGWATGAEIRVIQDGAAGVDYVPTEMIFTTCSSTAEHANQLVLDGITGNIGIGTIAPLTKLHIVSTTGITAGDGNDTDQDLITVNVTGTPKLWWDEATDSFEFNKSLTIPGGSLKIGGIVLTDDDSCLRTSDFHAHGNGSVAGYYKLHQGTTPVANKEADHSILWVDGSGDLYLENAAGTDKRLLAMDASNSLSVARSIIPTTGADRAAINFGGGGSLIGATADTDALFLANAYYNSGYKYLTTDLASAIKLDDGEIVLSTAISGTVDEAIVWKDVIKVAVGKVFINETANAEMTEGLTINQGGFDNEIFALKSSDVGHSMTGLTEADTYFCLRKLNAAAGGANIRGLSDDDQPGLVFQGIMGTATPTKDNPAVKIQGIKYNGETGATAMAADETVLAVISGTSFVVMGSGNVGIGVVDPDATLEINGQIKITGGTPGAGKVLTSDANGLASWV